jgi:two-component sensor histidine kinase
LRKKRNELYQVNQQLSQKNIQIELLNKEIHHRVKNNLQIINSLLFMQFKDNDDEKIKAQIKHSQERIKSMALVHNKLYEADSTVPVYIKEYIKELASDILKTNTPAGKSIGLNIEENVAVNLSLDTSVSLGLILNELITNACKYAFAGKETGHINIAINKQAGGYQLIVKDDGSGLTNDFHQKNSMGLRLVTNLSKQLGGQATFENNNGTVVIVDFVDTVAA